jgi:hypothetical protein
MSSNTLLNKESRSSERPDMASFLQKFERRMLPTTNQNNKNTNMSTKKNLSIPNHIFSWEYNMNELEFE